MNDIIEVKGMPLDNIFKRILKCFIMLIPLIIGIKIFRTDFTMGVYTMITFLIFWYIPISLYFGIKNFYFPQKIIIVSGFFIVERVFIDNFMIPLKNITEINTHTSKSIINPDFIVKYDNKKITLSQYHFKPYSEDFEKFINELQFRINIEKKK